MLGREGMSGKGGSTTLGEGELEVLVEKGCGLSLP